ncbi:hypothetical protein [Stenomitos frigidus]|uniref:Low temperature-induced protein n=1 Tax=Stenomitos frigidus ULC18 TaxID=2107698 RepID=A0A2T1DSY4_9CYAN|nr:hypothetical protein [Stenomitos frigidus]PSB23598.1 hypothetical protein C7B82_30425 [Stenomitos frigidus ULC18]
MKDVLTALRPLRYFLTLCLCAVLLFSYVTPVFAAPIKNEPNAAANQAAKEYEQESRNAIATDHPPNLSETQAKTRGGGLNEVQGKAGLKEMKRPSNSGSIPSVEKDIKNVLEKVQDKVGG